MIEQVELHNFKSHRSTKLNLDSSRLHALVGQNSSGKTSVLQALYCLFRLFDSPFKDVFVSQLSPGFISTVGQDHVSVVINGSFGKNDNDQRHWMATYEFDLTTTSSGDIFAVPVMEFTDDKVREVGGKVIFGQRLNPQGKEKSLSEATLSNELKSVVHLKLATANLSKAAYSESITPKLEFDGSSLAPTLDYLRNESPEEFQSLQKMLQRIVPGVHTVGIRRAKVKIERKRLIEVDGKSISYEENQEVAGQEVVLDMNTGDRIPAHAISEGTMITLGLLTVLMSPNRPKLVLLDDIEQGLHPNAQRQLVNVLKEIIQANEDLQIIFSTHSPYIVDELSPSQVHVLSNSNGFTHVKRLDEHPDVEWAKQTLTTGEFWDAEGEDWVTNGEVDG
jgi:predicted ATPase